jgi:6-phosphogluconolactonase
MKRLLAIIVASLATAAAAWAQPDAIPGVDHGRGHSGDGPAPRALYTQTNAADGNAVLVFDRNRGALELAATVRTHGLGTGVGLGSQSSVALSRDGRLLFVVNAGSDSISAFLIGPRGPVLVDRVRSGGDQPISLALHDNLLYVLNAGTTANVTGFRIGFAGRLQPVRGSTRPLSGAAVQPAQVQFNNTGDFLATASICMW